MRGGALGAFLLALGVLPMPSTLPPPRVYREGPDGELEPVDVPPEVLDTLDAALAERRLAEELQPDPAELERMVAPLLVGRGKSRPPRRDPFRPREPGTKAARKRERQARRKARKAGRRK